MLVFASFTCFDGQMGIDFVVADLARLLDAPHFNSLDPHTHKETHRVVGSHPFCTGGWAPNTN